MKQLLAGLSLWLACQSLLLAAPIEVQHIRLWSAPDHTRVVFDASGPVAYQLTSRHSPERLEIDVPRATAAAEVYRQRKGVGLISGIQAAPVSGDAVRIVLNLRQPVRPRSFTLKPTGPHGHRLVVDLYDAAASRTGNAGAKALTKPGSATAKATANEERRARKSLSRDMLPTRDLVIAIDAGHGGEDTGAIGRGGTYEKNVTLAIARRLAALVKKTPGMQPVMIRNGDYYIGLRQRINKAREHKADLFVSIHADSFHDSRVQGSSVFVLSNRGASSEMARWLAEKENAADLAGGVSLDDKDDGLAKVLLDLSQNASIEASFNVADNILGELEQVGKTHRSRVQQAGFVVLKSPDIPSVLVETAFISNPLEERKLRNNRHQEALATAMMRGIDRYFMNHPPPGTRLAARNHVIRRGDTLGVIAQQYDVSTATLKHYNGLKSDLLHIGDTLRIPPSGG